MPSATRSVPGSTGTTMPKRPTTHQEAADDHGAGHGRSLAHAVDGRDAPGNDGGPGPRGPGPPSGLAVLSPRSGRCQCSLVGSGGGRVAELVGLVDDVGGDLAELVAVLAGVVGAEQQLATRLELDPEVGLGSATVAAVRGAERRSSGQLQWSHRPHFSFVRCRFQRSRGGEDSLDPPVATCRPTR